jgi:hypothetical protein
MHAGTIGLRRGLPNNAVAKELRQFKGGTKIRIFVVAGRKAGGEKTEVLGGLSATLKLNLLPGLNFTTSGLLVTRQLTHGWFPRI